MPKILVADDSDIDLQLTQRALKKAAVGYELSMVEDGAQAVASFDDDVVLAFLDHRMPGMGAEHVLREIGSERLAAVPVILFSSAVSPSDVDLCVGLGAREYVEKPTDPSAYSAAIAAVVARYLPAVEPSSA